MYWAPRRRGITLGAAARAIGRRSTVPCLCEIRRVPAAHRGRYGAPRVPATLRAEGHTASRSRVERLMRHHGIRPRMRRPFRVRTTDSHHDLPIAPNLLEQTFVATRPNQVWLADIPYVPTAEGWPYLAVLDLFPRKIVGRAMRDPRRAELAVAALSMAIQRQKPPPGLIHHSDRGSQYAAADYRKVLGAAGMIQSMSRKGNCWDNAPRESRTRAPGLLQNPGCRPARLVRLHRRILHSSAASFRPRVHRPRTGRAPSRLIRCPPNRGKVTSRLAGQSV